MALPTEPIGSIPRPGYLIEAGAALADGRIPRSEYDRLAGEAVRDTVERFEATGSRVSRPIRCTACRMSSRVA
jgi:5-methyltetrahydropteroyltriglutamate--homocysteine methyltransferase